MRDSARRSLGRALVRLGAAVGFLQTYGLPFRWNRGPEGRWWELLRRHLSRFCGRIFDSRAGPRPITAGEYAGSLDGSPNESEALLWEEGFVRSPLSRLKTRGGEPESGSWVYRESPLARRQLHLVLFEGSAGTTDVYAHEEVSNVNPFVGLRHFRGDAQNVSAGVERARDRLPLATVDADAEPPDGPWDAELD